MLQNENDNRKVIAGWDFVDFRNNYKEVFRPKFTNKETGDQFTKLAFKNAGGGYCFVGFSKELGEPTNEELKAQADTLRIVQLEVTDEERAHRKEKGLQEETYKVCKRGDYQEWEKVDI